MIVKTVFCEKETSFIKVELKVNTFQILYFIQNEETECKVINICHHKWQEKVEKESYGHRKIDGRNKRNLRDNPPLLSFFVQTCNSTSF